MRIPILLSILWLLLTSCGRRAEADASTPVSSVVTSDLDRFWEAYDTVRSTQDSLEQLRLVHRLFIDKASPGQEALFAVRGYTPEEYVDYINAYPKFYASIRASMAKHQSAIDNLDSYLARLKRLYPQATPAKVYLGIGNLRTPGTTVDSMVLIGAEMVFGNDQIDVSEFPNDLQYVKDYMQTNPVGELEFLAAHEYVHTQQVESFGVGLLATSLREGSAELIAELASGKKSSSPALTYGQDYEEAVFSAFQKQMFNQSTGYWLWTSADNKFKMRDLGYYTGYRLASHYYHQHSDSLLAIRNLIELDYADEAAVRNFVDSMGYFDDSMVDLLTSYRESQPYVTQVEQRGNQFIVHFSEPMHPDHRGFDYGPLGEEAVLSVARFLGFSDDSTSLTFEADLKPMIQQVVLTRNFRNVNGIEMKNYLIETGK